MESEKCVICGATSPHSLGKRHVDKEITYTLHACSVCKAQFWTPFMNPGSTWYEHDVRYADRNADPILKPNEKHRAVISFFKRKKGNVLDVGCGVGNFLAYAIVNGWKGWGIDFDRDAIAAGKATFNIENMEVASTKEFKEIHPDLKFDLITYFDVFEHLDNHTEFITEIGQMLEPRGSVALSIPYRHGWRWLMPSDLPPRHLTRWDEESLRIFYERNGFRILKLQRFPASFSFLVMKLRFRYGRWASIGLVRKVQSSNMLATTQADTRMPPRTTRIHVVHMLARAKDLLLFGIPAAVLWFTLLFTKARYTDFLCIATRSDYA